MSETTRPRGGQWHRLPRVLRGVAAASAALLLTACATPYVKTAAPPTGAQGGPPTLDASVLYAHSVQAQYRDKLVELGESERTLSNRLIVLGGGVLGLGVLGAHASLIKGIAVVGGTAYTVGTFSIDKNRAAVYGAGMEALDCAVGMVSPMQLGNTTLADLRARVDGGNALRDAVVAQYEVVTSLIPGVTGDSGTAATQAQSEAVKVLNASTDVAAAGDVLLLRHEQAGPDLRNVVVAIDTQVTNAVRSLEVDLRSVPGALAKLAENSAMFGKLATQSVTYTVDAKPMAAAGDTRESASARLNTEVSKLRVATARLAHENVRLSKLLAAIKTDTAANVHSCKVPLPFFVVSVSPSTLTLSLPEAATATAFISGGNISNNHTPTYASTSVSIPDASITHSIQGNRLLVAKAANARAATHIIRVEETQSNTFKDVAVTVGAGAGAGTPGTPAAQPAAASADLAAAKAALDGQTLPLDNGKITIVSATIDGTDLVVKYKVDSGTATREEVLSKLLSMREVKPIGALALTVQPV